MKHTRILEAVLASSLLFGGQAYATDPISIQDNTGTYQVGSLDWTQDNALAVDVIPLTVDNTFTFVYQSSLGNYVGTDGKTIQNTGLNADYEITMTMEFTEVVETVVCLPDPTNCSTADSVFTSFGLSSASTTSIKIYYDTGMDFDQKLGTGYDNGDLILTAEVTLNDSNFQTHFDRGILALDDSADGNDFENVGTFAGNGGGDIEAAVTMLNQDRDFFLDDDALKSIIVALFFNTSQIVPFKEANPALGTDGTDGNVVGYTPDLTPCTQVLSAAECTALGLDYINGGAGPNTTGSYDFIFQADANTSFDVEKVQVPEPTILALMGLGLFGVAGMRRKLGK